jgi:molybdopterin molybdotransferase
VTPLSWDEARRRVIDEVRLHYVPPRTAGVPIEHCLGRVLAESIYADRSYPASSRSMRDGFAVRASDIPGRLNVAGMVRAGDVSLTRVGPGQAVEIMTGAPVPPGADAIVMVEHVSRDGDWITTDRSAKEGDHIDPRGSHAQMGNVVLHAGTRLDFTHAGLLATVGVVAPEVYQQLHVAILATGDELVAVDANPGDHQIRNSNSYSLALQVQRAGAIPRTLPPCVDSFEATRAAILSGLDSDLLLISGGVSAGKYDIVEPVLKELGAEFYFDRVLIQPGQPLVFGRVNNKVFFGLPGNPLSTIVTFEVFARAALELMSGQAESSLPLLFGRLTQEFRQKPGLKRFLPARRSVHGSEVTPLHWKGSGDVFGLAQANAFLVTDENRDYWNAGDLIEVLPI